MKSCFSSCRSVLSILFCLLLFVFVIVGIPLLSLSFVITEPENIKSSLREVNLYENIYDIALDISSENESWDYINKIGEDKEELVSTFKRIITPEWLQENVEKVIDSTYIWLDGGGQIPEFTIDLTEIKTNIVDESTDYLIDSINNLPDCSESEMKEIESGSWNPYDMNCKPSDFEASAYEEEMRIKIQEELDKNESLEKDEFSSSEVIKLDEDLVEKIQKGYMIFKKFPIIIGAGILITVLLVFIFMPGLSNKLLALGITLVLSGALLLFGAYYTNSNFDSIFEKQMNRVDIQQGSGSIGLISELVQSLLDDIQSHIRQYSLAIVIVGFILFIGGIILKFTKKKYYIKDEGGDDSSSTKKDENNDTITAKKDLPEVKLK